MESLDGERIAVISFTVNMTLPTLFLRCLASLVPRPRSRREKWPGIHCLRMREKPHDFMGYRIPSFTNR